MRFQNQYLNYNEYFNLGGKLKDAPFNLLEFEARKIIDKYTSGRLKNFEEQVQEVKLCMYSLINEIYKDNSSDDNKTSESIGSYSVNYAVLNSSDKKKKYKFIVEDYLIDCRLENGTPYLYLG